MKKLRNTILGLLTEDARLTPSEIAKITGADEATVISEIKALEDSGVICKYTVVVDGELAGKDDVEALIEVKVSPMHKHGFDSIAEEIYRFDEVKTVYLMSGAYDLCVVIEGRTLKEVARFVSEKLSVMDKVLSTATHFILKKYKVNGVLMKSEEKGWNNRQAVHA
ncbi:MAG: Lrp/AsnC family transcriptional regulator [Clostridia bacterium]|nr:Lrp/AsnC family transcriptional regulator [Clostridia bacterium]